MSNLWSLKKVPISPTMLWIACMHWRTTCRKCMTWSCVLVQRKGYTDQQLISGRSIQASYSWLNREKDDYGTHKERRISRLGSTMKDAYAEILTTELDLDQQADLVPFSFVAQYNQIYVRPEHPTTAKTMTYNGETTERLPMCSDVMHEWAMNLVSGYQSPLTRIDPLYSPDLLFPMPTRESFLFHVTASDVELLIRPKEGEVRIEAWEALIALFFAAPQTTRTCREYERNNKSPFASYHQHALVTPDTLILSLPEKLVPRGDEANPPIASHGLWTDHQEANVTVQDWNETLNSCNIKKAAVVSSMTYHWQLTPDSKDKRIWIRQHEDWHQLWFLPLRPWISSQIQEADLGKGCTLNQGMVAPFFQAYEQVRRSMIQILNNKGPVETLKSSNPEDPSQWNDDVFVAQTQVIEEMATKILTQDKGVGAKMIKYTRHRQSQKIKQQR